MEFKSKVKILKGFYQGKAGKVIGIEPTQAATDDKPAREEMLLVRLRCGLLFGVIDVWMPYSWLVLV